MAGDSTNGLPPEQGLNILCVGTLPPHPGGSGISTYQLLLALVRMGHKVRVLSPVTQEALQSGDRFALRYPQISVNRFLVPCFDVASPIPGPPEYREVEREKLLKILPSLIAESRPDVILIGRESFAWDVPDIARSHHIPSVLSVRGGTRTAKLLNGGYPETLARRLLAEYRKTNVIVVVARHLADGLRRLGLDDVKIIPNAVNLDLFFPRPADAALRHRLAIGEEDIVVMHVANLQARKRSLDLVLSAESALPENPRLMYVIVGDGPLRPSMEQLCRERAISGRFRFIGWVEYECMPDYVNLADLMVMPSEAEGLSRVYLETLACGGVLLASDIPPAREVVVDGQSGLLFEKGNIDSLTAKTLLAARDHALRESIGNKARERARAYSLDKVAAAYSALLQDVVRLFSP